LRGGVIHKKGYGWVAAFLGSGIGNSGIGFGFGFGLWGNKNTTRELESMEADIRRMRFA
jgi:hypothetical protein